MAETADRWGVAASWEDAQGALHRVPRSTITRLRELIGEADADERVLVVRRGQQLSALTGRLHLEDGGVIDVDGAIGADVPLGYHVLDAGATERRVIVTPPSCRAVVERAWGWAVQLYAARSASSWGIGDLGDLAEIGRRSAEPLGAGFLLVNPLHAAFPGAGQQPSPYSPSTRRFLNPLFVRVADVPGAASIGGDLAALAARGEALNASRLIDRDAALATKSDALQRIWDGGGPRRDPAFERWRTDRGAALHDFGTWTTIAEQHGSRWRAWPAGMRRPDGPAVRRFADQHADRIMFHSWLQWLLDVQLTAAAAEIGVISDLPIGFDPDGFDAWAWQDQLALDVSVGAPPDEFNTQGQDWGLPPFVPWKLAAAGYQPFVDTLRAVLRPPVHGRLNGLRIDHVMGLFRLWWIPPGCTPDQGGYVRGMADALLGILALESQRSGAIVIGEDLGTVEAGVPERLAEHEILSYRVVWFEQDTPHAWPVGSLGSVSTHDLPTVAGLWSGDDLREQEELGLRPNVAGTNEIRTRLRASTGLDDDAEVHDVIVATHRLLATAPSALLTATLEDAGGEPRRPNVPGAGADRPNWCIALPTTIDELLASERAITIAETMRAATRTA